MDFRRIDNDTVQCILSEEEMNAYGFGIEDFFSDQEKAREFLEHLVERAEEEVGYEAKGGMVSMQVMKMPNNDLVITLSDRDINEGFQNMLQHIHQQLASLIDPDVLQRLHSQEDFPEEAAELEGLADRQSYEEFFQQAAGLAERQSYEEFLRQTGGVADSQSYAEFLRQAEKRKEKAYRDKLSAPRLFRFEGFHVLEQFVVAVTLEKPINSAIYYNAEDECYYLLLKKGKLRLEEYKKLCEQTGEFAVLCSMQPYMEQFCKEHFETVISKQAIRTLKNIETGNI